MQQLSQRIGLVSPVLLCLAFFAACGGNSPDSQPNGDASAGSGDGGADTSAAGTSSKGGSDASTGDAGGEAAGGADTSGGGTPGEGGAPSGDAGSDNTGTAGAGEGGAGGGDAQVPTGVHVISISPSAGEQHVAPLSNIVIQLSGPVNEDTFRVPPAVLAPKASLGLKAQISYDPVSYAITIDPALPLVAGGIHRVNLGGLKDLDGNAVDFDSEFRVAFQSPTLTRYYSLDGKPTSGYAYKLTDEGRVGLRLDIDGPGNDGELGTDDDEYSAYYEYDWLAGSEDNYASYFDGPGNDKLWFTKDDTQSSRTFSSSPVVGESRSGYRNAGVDGKFGTADDGWDQLCRVSFAADGRESQYLCFSGTGSDKQPFTDDDPLSYYYLDSFLPGAAPYEDGSVQWRPYYSGGSGLDATWMTDDDPVSSINESRFDVDGFLRLGLQILAGDDTKPGTKDDTVQFALSALRDKNGSMELRYKLDGPGKDGLWETEDDALAPVLWKYKHEDDGRLVWMGMYGAGKDLIPNTDDDVLVLEELHDSPL